MKNLVCILFFVFLSIYGYSQYVHYGYPTDKPLLRKGDVIILNIPVFFLNRGNEFVNPDEFDDMVKLFELNDTNTFRIEVNNFLGLDSSVCASLSGRLCDNIQKILTAKTSLKNYYIVSNGLTNPISCKEKEQNGYIYIYRNSRIEIIVE